MARERANEYKRAAPFPNICIDDFLPEDMAHALSAAFPRQDDIGWIERDNKNNRRRYQNDETQLPHLLREMLESSTRVSSRSFSKRCQASIACSPIHISSAAERT